jgi:hypothetical protein
MMIKYKVSCLTGFIFIGLFLAGCKKEKNRICELYDGSVGYAVGGIDKVTSSLGKATYTYSFEVDGESYDGKEKAYGIGQKDESLIGKQFVVVYALGNPSNSDLNTDFLIESDIDFQEFKSEYSTSPPPPDFPNKCN